MRKIVYLGLVLCVVFSGTSMAAKEQEGRKRFLLLDKRIISGIQDAELVLGEVKKDERNPLFMEDKPWEPRYDNVYANVIYDYQDKIYKCWYSPFIIDERTTSTPKKVDSTTCWTSSSRDSPMG